MSNLDYPISLLQAEREKICHHLASTGDNQLQSAAQFDAVNKAINILIKEKTREEEKKIRERVKKIRKGIVNDKNIKL